ncbi:hypothetical protein IQ268_16030 [Oculatella sp. LEGE 06141]|uniref:hypothetical protein n=1 Tax=Oculatella sp. LEGE 06141 TaxID=1828648 RepID=UPI00187FD152|nr:hypothetical protein [Oculatella sp. LEGE 06141]MBE9180080.1 hypothetical protein [Oculatella sp. LEGE 06141]
MDRKVPAPVAEERLAQASFEQNAEAALNRFHQAELSPEGNALNECLVEYADVFDQVSQLDVGAKLALIRKLMAHLEIDQVQAILEFGQREIAERQRHTPSTTAASSHTRLLLKKDYSYQDRGLSEPTQYYVYLRRRKPKLDRYIGTLFYLPQGCALSYFPDTEGRIIFNPPHNVFQLKDAKDASVVQIVRLICLEPPPPDYTFTKQQNDMPDIFLRLEYLDPTTFRPIREESYPFPFCMYEGGQLDRYRWDVSVILPSELPVPNQHTVPKRGEKPPPKAHSSQSSSPETSMNGSSLQSKTSLPPVPGKPAASRTPRRIVELPAPVSSTFYLTNRCDASPILERMRLWVAWSEKAMPQSRWEIVQTGAVYTLMNATFKRDILSFSLDHASVSLENSLPVLMKWFHDLSLAVSQSQSQRQYSPAQLKLAHSLFVEMSLPQTEPLVVLKKLFDVSFSKTSLYK